MPTPRRRKARQHAGLEPEAVPARSERSTSAAPDNLAADLREQEQPLGRLLRAEASTVPPDSFGRIAPGPRIHASRSASLSAGRDRDHPDLFSLPWRLA